MGLDVYAYSKVRRCTQEEIEKERWNFQVYLATPEWAHKVKHLVTNGYYVGKLSKVSVGASYGGHSIFRGFLLKLIGREDLLRPDGSVNYNLVLTEEAFPFLELIDFSDCEGCLDWETAGVIYQNFVDYSDKATELLESEDENDKHWAKHYFRWMEVMAVGKEVGNVVNFC